jgi:hypothetical protein
VTVRIDYQPDGPVLNKFMADDRFFRCIVGPFGSGKSAACAIEVFCRSCQQAPDSKGVRRTRWAAIRATYPQLRNTTIGSWGQWFHDGFAAFRWNPTPQHHVIMPLADRTILDMRVDFIALDGPTAEADLRGAELTGCWINEISEVPKNVVTFALGRVGRYPAMKDGGPTWSGIVADSNAWDQDHWLHGMYLDPPANWKFYRQPGAVVKSGQRWELNPAAENATHLPTDYYTRMLAGQGEDWIRVYLANEFAYAIDGRPVYAEWSDSVHVAQDIIEPIENLPVFIGLDFGLTPAAVFGQRDAKGRWRILDELVSEDMGVQRFSELLAKHLDEFYGHLNNNLFQAYGDPAGSQRAQTDEKTCLAIVREYTNVEVRAAPTNDFTLRRESVAGALNRMIDGKPGFQLSPICKMLRKGFAGGYHFKRVKVSGAERYHDKADKNEFSHCHDALQYLMSGAGEGRVVMRKDKLPVHMLPTRSNSSYHPHHWRAGR